MAAWAKRLLVATDRYSDLAASAATMPFRIIVRKYYCTRIASLAGIPTYLTKTEEDLRVGPTDVAVALQAVEKYAPIWSKRLPRLFRHLIIINTVDAVAYFSADRCCFINPWKLKLLVETPAAAQLLLGSDLVGLAAKASLLSGRFGPLTFRQMKLLSVKTSLRFLRRAALEASSPALATIISVTEQSIASLS